MKRLTIGFLLAGSLASLLPGTITATGDRHSAPREESFQRVGTLANYRNNGDAARPETESPRR